MDLYIITIALLIAAIAYLFMRVVQLKNEARTNAGRVNKILRDAGLVLALTIPVAMPGQTVIDTEGACYQWDQTPGAEVIEIEPIRFGRPATEEICIETISYVDHGTVVAYIDSGLRVSLHKMVPSIHGVNSVTKYYLGDELIDPERIKIILR